MNHHYGNDNPRLAAARMAAQKDLHHRYARRARCGTAGFFVVVGAAVLAALPAILARL